MNKYRLLLWWLAGLALSLLLAACGPGPISTIDDVSRSHTQAVKTVSVQLTLDAGNTAVAQLTQLAQATDTPFPVFVSTSTIVLLPPTSTSFPTPTPPPATPTTPSTPCDWLEFISDVTVPDGKEYSPGTQFTKTWRLKNIGSCTWTRDYDLVFFSGDQMSGTSAIPLEGDIPPGAMVDVSVTLTAPASDGIYIGYWELRNTYGTLFGGGGYADQPFYVRIKVDQSDSIFYDMAQNYCKADWTNSFAPLECPTSIQDEFIGFVYSDNNPRLETGVREDELTLITHPDAGGTMRYDFLGEQGLIAGTFPRLLIEDGDRFEATIGCMFGHEDCNVLFYLMVEKSKGNYEVLGSWQEYYDGQVTQISLNLSDWAGKEIRLLLAVVANGSSQADDAFWFQPRLIR